MVGLVVLALIGAVIKLWADVSALRDRVRAMELGEPTRLSDFPADWAIVRPIADPVPEATTEPEATQPMTARIVPAATATIAPAIMVSPRPDPEPGPRFAPDEQAGGTPGDTPERIVPPSHERSAPLQTAEEPAAPRPALNFEDIFGRKLPIWAGGITLAVCGFLIVKYSIDAGLLSPWVRVIGGLLFGSGLIAGAEAARQNEGRVRDPRVAQALAGAGIATLYASILVAVNLYALIPPLTAFVGLAAITVLAGFLSIRFGAPSAVLGLVGGLAAPALVGSGNPNVPLLAAYLSLAVGGLATLGRTQRWWWLGVAALIGGFGWGLVLIFAGALGVTGSWADSLAVGGFLLLLGVGLPVLLFGGAKEDGRGHVVRLAGTLAATAQLAALVATGGFAMLNWGLFGLLGIASVWLSRREQPLADLPAPALVTALLLMTAWPAPSANELAAVLGGAALIFGLPAAWRVWRPEARLSDAGAVAALAAAPIVLALLHVDPSDRTATLLALLGTAIAGAVAALGWRNETRREDTRFALLVSTAAVLAAIAALFGLTQIAVAPAWSLIAGAALLLARRAEDKRVEVTAWTMQIAAIVALVLLPLTGGALDRAYGEGGALFWRLDGWEALRWTIPAAVAVLFALRTSAAAGRMAGAVLAVLLGYVALAQVVPAALVPLIPASGLAALGWFRGQRVGADAAVATAGALSALWAAWPLAQWLAAGGGALLGFPLFVDALPGMADAATRLLAPAVAVTLIGWRHPPANATLRRGAATGLALLGTAVAHIAYKQLFALDSQADFVRLGLAERTVWEALLALVAVALFRRLPGVARIVGLAALAHLAWFTLLLHNPLWSEQAVGSAPIVNLLLPVYALGFALLWAAGRAALMPLAERARGWGMMLLTLLFAASELRQLFAGTLLTTRGIGETEDILRSVAAIGIAIGFLQWGIRRRRRDWRIASLVVMLGAVAKVFVFDASGLDGLLRIASFAALGFSLIGLGWLYSRYLPDGGVEPTRAPAQAGAQSAEREAL